MAYILSIDLIHKSHNALVPYPTYAHFCSEGCSVGYGTQENTFENVVSAMLAILLRPQRDKLPSDDYGACLYVVFYDVSGGTRCIIIVFYYALGLEYTSIHRFPRPWIYVYSSISEIPDTGNTDFRRILKNYSYFSICCRPIHENDGESLQWRHNECDGVSNHRRLEHLLNRLFSRR